MLRRHYRAESTGFRWMNRHCFGWLTKVAREGKGMDPNPYLGLGGANDPGWSTPTSVADRMPKKKLPKEML